jgi:transcriptional regulator GlxA family with amidase domain
MVRNSGNPAGCDTLSFGDPSMNARVRKAIAVIKADIRRDVPQEQLAKDLNVSYSRLRHLFKDEVGLSPSQYLKLLRMERAKYLLENTFLNTKQIMIKTGVKDHSHFTRDFKKAYGLTPIRHREYVMKASSVPEINKVSEDIARSANK